MSRVGASRNPIERVIRAFRGLFAPVYLICHCYLSLFLFSLRDIRAYLLFYIKAPRIEEEEIEEMTNTVYGGKQPPESPVTPFPALMSAPLLVPR